MDYPAFRARGLVLSPRRIGSGAIDSATKHLVQQRLKRAGMRWSDPGGAGILALLAWLTSGRAIPSFAFACQPPTPRAA